MDRENTAMEPSIITTITIGTITTMVIGIAVITTGIEGRRLAGRSLRPAGVIRRSADFRPLQRDVFRPLEETTGSDYKWVRSIARRRPRPRK